MENENENEIRLCSPVFGETNTAPRGTGFTVSLPNHPVICALRRLRKTRALRIYSPTDGAVIEKQSERITLRTADGIEVYISCSGAFFTATHGSVVRCGECIGKARLDAKSRASAGNIEVMLPKPQQITELHVFTGIHRSGAVSATFHRLPSQ